MRDTSQDTVEMGRLWRWIHNNLPGEPRGPQGIVDTTIRIISEQRAEIERLRAERVRSDA